MIRTKEKEVNFHISDDDVHDVDAGTSIIDLLTRMLKKNNLLKFVQKSEKW